MLTSDVEVLGEVVEQATVSTEVIRVSDVSITEATSQVTLLQRPANVLVTFDPSASI